MSEETTHHLPDERSFEERVFARFDALDAGMARMESRLEKVEARLDKVETQMENVNARLQTLESESERRAVETKPIWERVLAEIVALGQKVDALERKVNLLVLDMMTLRADQTRLEGRMDKLESEPAR
jgi:chromosome segregation ATPase